MSFTTQILQPRLSCHLVKIVSITIKPTKWQFKLSKSSTSQTSPRNRALTRTKAVQQGARTPAHLLPQIPSPPGLPLLGHVLDFIKSPFFPQQLAVWAGEYGGIYTIHLAGNQYYVVTDPDMMHQVLGRGVDRYPEGPLPKADSIYTGWSLLETQEPDIRGLFTKLDSEDPTWKAVRRAFGAAMGPAGARELLPEVVERAQVLVSALGQYASSAGPGSPCDMSHYAKLFTLDVLVQAGLEVQLHSLEAGRSGLVDRLEQVMDELMDRKRNPGRALVPWLFKERNRQGEEAVDTFHEAIDDLLNQAKARGPPPADNSRLWAQLLRMKDPKTGAPLTEAQLHTEVATLVVGGSETTAHAVTYATAVLACRPGIADQLRHEMTATGLLDESRPGSLSCPVSWDLMQAGALPLLDAFQHEVLRMFSITPNGSIRQTEQDYQLGQYRVPAGSLIWVPLWALHMSPQHWQRPEEFSLERWFHEQPQNSRGSCPVSATMAAAQRILAGPHVEAQQASWPSLKHKNQLPPPQQRQQQQEEVEAPQRVLMQHVPEAYAPFSEGSRTCPGKQLALIELRVALLHLLAAYDLQLAPEVGGWEGIPARRRARLVLEAAGGMPIILKPRA